MLWLHSAMRMTSTTKKCWNYCFVLSSPVKSWVVIDLRRIGYQAFSLSWEGMTHRQIVGVLQAGLHELSRRGGKVCSALQCTPATVGWDHFCCCCCPFLGCFPPQTACKIMSDGQLYGCLNVSQSIIFVNQRKKALFITISEWFGV